MNEGGKEVLHLARIFLAFLLGYLLLASCQLSMPETMTLVKPNESAEPSSSEPVLVWERERANECHTIAINTQGQAQFGICSSPLSTGTILSEMERPKDLRRFLDSFPPFKVDTPAGRVDFAGYGANSAKASEQRAIAEWASIVYQELLYSRGGASWGMAMALNREGAHPCQLIQIEVYGKVMANDCSGEVHAYPPMWLTAEQLDRLYGWIDKFQAGELEFQDKDGQPMRFIFGGKGDQAATSPELEEMLGWIERIYEMVVR